MGRMSEPDKEMYNGDVCEWKDVAVDDCVCPCENMVECAECCGRVRKHTSRTAEQLGQNNKVSSGDVCVQIFGEGFLHEQKR